MQLNATYKGLITGGLIIIFYIIVNLLLSTNGSSLAFVSPVIYGLGVVWAITSFAKQNGNQSGFGKLFNQGFKCFIVVTLLVVLYYIIFYKLHPEIIEQSATATREHLLKTEKNRTPAEIEQQVQNGKKYFIPMMASITMFQHLIIGAIVSVATAGVLSLPKKQA
ncbi:MAG: DUF4199 domain-containing protein [Niabella sp.]